jgi:hypothetical protein
MLPLSMALVEGKPADQSASPGAVRSTPSRQNELLGACLPPASVAPPLFGVGVELIVEVTEAKLKRSACDARGAPRATLYQIARLAHVRRPGERLISSNFCKLLAAKLRLVIHEGFDSGEPGRPADSIGEYRIASADLAVRGNVRGYDRGPGCQTFNDGQTETLSERRRNESRRIGHQPRKTRISEVRRFRHERREGAGALEHVNDVLVLPATAPRDYEPRRARAMPLDQTAPNLK